MLHAHANPPLSLNKWAYLSFASDSRSWGTWQMCLFSEKPGSSGPLRPSCWHLTSPLTQQWQHRAAHMHRSDSLVKVLYRIYHNMHTAALGVCILLVIFSSDPLEWETSVHLRSQSWHVCCSLVLKVRSFGSPSLREYIICPGRPEDIASFIFSRVLELSDVYKSTLGLLGLSNDNVD